MSRADTRTEMRRSVVRETVAGIAANQSPISNPSPVDGHMQEWLEAGWDLYSLTTVPHAGSGGDLVHVFFWARADSGTPSL